MQVKIKSEKKVYDGFFKIVEAEIEHERFNGSMQTINRLCFECGDAVAAVVFDPTTHELLFTEQFRYPAYARTGNPTIIELMAGKLDPGEDKDAALEREMREELGYEIKNKKYLGHYFVSPGGTTEGIHLYYVEAGKKIGNGGGLLEENEDIKIVRIKTSELYNEIMWSLGQQKPITNFYFNDAKTQLGLELSKNLWS